ncbi:MAG TPA: hypothetical protein VKF38_10470 [Anaerolineaceae bacterium]|nr:hypothetical protein [Anaerolineaceae bacterium]
MSEKDETETEEMKHYKEARNHFRAAKQAMRKSVEAFLPPGVIEQRRLARKEFLLGLRTMVDAAIETIEDNSKKAS